MSRKNYLKQKGYCEFSRIEGIDAYEMNGGSGCIITRKTVFRRINNNRRAYFAYVGFPIYGANYNIQVSNTCGVLNCVKREHLIAVYQPSKKEQEYIATYLKIEGKEQLAHTLQIPITLFEQYLTTIN